MSLSPINPFLTELHEKTTIPEDKFAYLEQRVLNNFYAYVLTKFLDEKKRSNLTKAQLAERIGREPAQVNRWLASPNNWTIATLTRLLLGISGEEPVLSSESLLNKPPRNENWESILEDEERLPALRSREAPGTTRVRATFRELV